MEPLRIFLSYPSSCYDVAESIFHELKNQGHHVFFDKSRLEAAKPYSASIQTEILACDLFLFLITPESVAPGRYTRTELRIARDQWNNPNGIILPVMLEETPLADIPKVLSAVHIFRAEGNVAFEVMMEVGRIAAVRRPDVDARPAPAPELRHRDPEYVYSPLQLRFAPETASGYAVSVIDTTAGFASANAFPIDPEVINGMLWASGGRAAVTTRRARVEPGTVRVPDILPSEADARSVGQALYQALFAPPLNELLASRLRSVDPQRQTGVRFLINTTDAPDLAGLPWEFLYNPRTEDFMFSARTTPVVRWLDLDPDQAVPTLAVKPPLRVLIVISAPPSRAELAVGEELHHLDRALGALAEAGQVEIYQLDHATLAGLNQALVDDRPHVLHFIGHGDFEGDDGVIMLESDDPPGEIAPLSGRRLATLLRNHLGSLRLVFLNSCMGATVSARNPFGGVAQNLIRRGVPAVIAMQFPIPDAVAIKLARRFYGYLAAGYAVDDALTCARAYLITDGHDVEWGAPALHMRSPDGRLFDFSSVVPPVHAAVSSGGMPVTDDVRSPLAHASDAPQVQAIVGTAGTPTASTDLLITSAESATPPASDAATTNDTSAIVPGHPVLMPAPPADPDRDSRVIGAPARADDRSRTRVLAVLGLIAVGVVGAVGVLSLRTGDVPLRSVAEEPPTTAVVASAVRVERQAADLAAAYQTVTTLLADEQLEAALAQLEGLGTPTAEVSAMVPESLRLNLADSLYQAAASAAVEDDRGRFGRIAAALIAVEPDASARSDMQTQLADMYEQITQPVATAGPGPLPDLAQIVQEPLPVVPARPDAPEQPIDPEPSPPAPAPAPPVTEPPVTEPPVTEPPVTEPPVTEPPVTEPPVTEPPVTEMPVTEMPATEMPATDVPATDVPATEPPDVPPPAVVTDPEPEPVVEPGPLPSIEPEPVPEPSTGPVEHSIDPAVPLDPASEPSPGPAPGVVASPGAALPAETTYRVQRGDTLWSISARHFGNPMDWVRIYHANRSVVTAPDRIFPGLQLVLPPVPVLARGPDTEIHVVAPGDSLWRLAAETYGDPLLWRHIHAANEDVIMDPNVLHPGQALRIPR